MSAGNRSGNRTYTPNPADLKALLPAARALSQANKALARYKKKSDAARGVICKWLKDARGLNVEAMRIGQRAEVKGVAYVEITSQNRLDTEALLLSKPRLYERFRRDFAVKNVKPLV